MEFSDFCLPLFSLSLVLSGCSLNSRPAGGSTIVQVQLPLAAGGVRPFAIPLSTNDFNCYAVNVTGGDIPPAGNCPAGPPGQYIGITAGAVPSSVGSISVEVPNGTGRVIQLIGFDTSTGNCYGEGDFHDNGKGYLLASATIDVLSSLNVTMTPNFVYPGSQTEFGSGCSVANRYAGYNFFHSFAGGFSDASLPYYNNLIFSKDGSTLYGMTYGGDSNGLGVLFSIPQGGGTPTVIHSFSPVSPDGEHPEGSLALSSDGSTLYGMTSAGGSSGVGEIFSQPTSGGAPTVLYSFTGTGTDGGTPTGSLTLSSDGSTLYGMTHNGGSAGSYGEIFSIPTSITTPTQLHAFSTATTDGEYPYGSLTLSKDGTTLYGMTQGGGLYGNGVIFSISTNGSAFTVLHSFKGGAGDGIQPNGSLTLSSDGNTLYGMTFAGGASNVGIIFSYVISTTTFNDLYEFTGSASDGKNPYGDLTLSNDGSLLFGMTQAGGPATDGVIFSFPTSGGTPTILYSFEGAPNDGKVPWGSLTLSSDGSTLYGMTTLGGANNDGGIFLLGI